MAALLLAHLHCKLDDRQDLDHIDIILDTPKLT